MNLTGKVALVTGANRGIGRGIAEVLQRAGARVVVNYPNDECAAEAREVVAELIAMGPEPLAVKADVASRSEINAMAAEVVSRYGRIDVLVNNAALDPGDTPFLEVDEAGYERVLGVNLKGVYFCTQAAARAMLGAGCGGKVINISSVQAQATLPQRSLYAASKGGVNALTRQLALELAPHGINVNAIAPGFIEVERTIRSRANYSREEVGQTIPIGRVGFPSDVGELVVFLASPKADFITGQVITIDGGTICKLAR